MQVLCQQRCPNIAHVGKDQCHGKMIEIQLALTLYLEKKQYYHALPLCDAAWAVEEQD